MREELKDLRLKGEVDELIEEEKYRLGEPSAEELQMPTEGDAGESLLEDWRKRAGRVHDSFTEQDREVHPESGKPLQEEFEVAYA